MNTQRHALWVELVTTRDRWGYQRVELGRMLRREPKNKQGFFVKVILQVPREIEVEGRAEIC